MPRLSDSMEEGTVLRWLKAEGDAVAIGDELVEIETDKANMVYESDAAGTLVEIVAAEGETLAIGQVIARVGDPGEAKQKVGAATAQQGGHHPAAPGRASEVREAAGDGERGPSGSEEAAGIDVGSPSAGDGRVKASPIARRIAAERGLDLAAIPGSGPGGRIVKADVERAGTLGTAGAAARPAPPLIPAGRAGAEQVPDVQSAKGEITVEELSKLQQTVARRMAESKATAPHFYLQAEIDMSRAVAARARIKATTPEPVPSFNDMIVKACAIALREHPRANGAYRDGRLELYSRVNVGIAVAAQEALTVPTIFDADRKGLREIALASRDLAAKVREGTITPPELSGGTFTVSNLGMFGIDNFAAVINPPQAGILAVGAINERPVVRDGEIATAHLMAVTLACDHRILFGAEGAGFLTRIRGLLEEPAGLAL